VSQESHIRAIWSGRQLPQDLHYQRVMCQIFALYHVLPESRPRTVVEWPRRIKSFVLNISFGAGNPSKMTEGRRGVPHAVPPLPVRPWSNQLFSLQEEPQMKNEYVEDRELRRVEHLRHYPLPHPNPVAPSAETPDRPGCPTSGPNTSPGNQQDRATLGQATSASRTPPWLPSRWGMPGRRLSRG
jgi:hypothetical protein